MHVFAYIKGILDYKITYSPGTPTGLIPIGYIDADYTGDLVETGHSTDLNIIIPLIFSCSVL